MLKDLMKKLTPEEKLNGSTRPYSNHSVEFKGVFTAEERAKMLEKVGLNVFFFPSEMITGCDFLSDSGTTTMTNEQWSSMHLGDEAYGSNKGYFILKERIQKTFGKKFFNEPSKNKPNAFIFHQGRACEDALFSILSQTGKELIIPSNGHFDTTQANIEANNIKAVNLFSPELKNKKSKSHFKGNIDIKKLETLLKKDSDKIPLVFLTITNNTGGGQPVSLKNIKETGKLVHKYGIPLFLDACRFSENAWFIKKYEKEYKNKKIIEIVHKIFSYADGFTISFKKDGLVNMGGGLFIKDEGMFIKRYPKIPEQLFNFQIKKEGHPTYGGLTGRDIMALATGLKTIVQEEYLNHRVSQVQEFGKQMIKKGIPVLTPIGGHAVYLDINEFFKGTKMKSGDFAGIAFTALLLAQYGHRVCELGNFAFGTYDKKTTEETFPEVNFVRFAVPRLKYEQQDLNAVVEAVKNIHKNKANIKPIEVTYGKDLALRHFKSKFRFKK